MVDESVRGGVLMRSEPTSARLFVVDLLLEQHRRFVEQLGEDGDDHAPRDEVAEHGLVVRRSPRCAPGRRRRRSARSGAGPARRRWPTVPAGRRRRRPRRPGRCVSAPRTMSQPSRRTRECRRSRRPARLDRSRRDPVEFEPPIMGAQSSTDGWVRSTRRAMGATPRVSPRHDRHLGATARAAVLAVDRNRRCSNARPGSVHTIHTSGVSCTGRFDAIDRTDHRQQPVVVDPAARRSPVQERRSAFVGDLDALDRGERVGQLDRCEVGDRLLVVVRHGEHQRVVPPVGEPPDHLAVGGVGGSILLDGPRPSRGRGGVTWCRAR